MTKKILLFLLCLCGFNLETLAKPSIAAIVDDKPITMYDLEERKKLFIALNNIKKIDGNLDQQLNSAALESLIDEQLLFDYADKIKNPITDEQIVQTISSIEKQNNLADGTFLNKLWANGLTSTSFKNQIKGEIIKMNIISGVSRGVRVSEKEVSEVILLSNAKDAAVSAKLFIADLPGNKTLVQMNTLRNKLTDCQNIKPELYNKFAALSNLEQNISELDPLTSAIIKDLKANQTSHIFKNNDGKLQLILLCEINLKDLKKEENEYITNILSNKKANQKARKFIDDLKKRTYIKILI